MSTRKRFVFALAFVAVVYLLSHKAHAASDGYQWERKVTAEDVAVTVAVVSELELAALRAKYERQPIDRSALGRVIPKHRYGFAMLYRDKTTGAFRCEVYLRDADDAATLEHELRHCHGWAHE